MTDYTYACDSLTNFECKTHAMTGNGSYVKLLKTCEIAFSEVIFGEFLAIWNYCAVSSACLHNPGSQQY